MSPVRHRRTLAAPSRVYQGVGLHSGADASICIYPAAPGFGLVFRDSATGQEIPARAANVTDTSRCTRLGLNGVSVQTVEHLLSALAGLGVDDAMIETEGGEMPAGDGSAAPFVALLHEAGFSEQEVTLSPMTLQGPMMVTEGDSTIVALPCSRFQATVVLDYSKYPALDVQAAEFSAGIDDYSTSVAPARTYGFISEIAALHARGLALGASLENALGIQDNGMYANRPRFLNEMARHKLLDLMGDLALVGQPVQAYIIAIKPSHTLNTRLAHLLS